MRNLAICNFQDLISYTIGYSYRKLPTVKITRLENYNQVGVL